MFVMFLIAFSCMITDEQFMGTNLGSGGSKMRFWGENWWVPDRKLKNRVSCFGARQASSWLAQDELPSSAPLFLVVSFSLRHEF